MEFLQNPQIDFMKTRRFWVALSVLLIVASLVEVVIKRQLNLGIDFVGGTQIILKFQEPPPVEDLRGYLRDAAIEAAQLQSFGAEGANEVMIRVPLAEATVEAASSAEGPVGDQEDRGRGTEVIAALSSGLGAGGGTFDLNLRGVDALGSHLLEVDPEELAALDRETAEEHYSEVAAAILELRREEGVLAGWEALSDLSEVSPEILSGLQETASLGPFALLGEEHVGPQIGSELRTKGILAVVFSLVGMLAYIWYRFELRFGLAALVALVHDVLITLGLFTLLDLEFNLSTIAAFLTLVGYSVNDTVVVFDRVRENMRREPRTPFVELLNKSLNQMLSRTVLTSGTTLLAVGSLYFLGGEVLGGFSFVLFAGVIIGTYSSIFIASPFALWWQQLSARRAKS